MNQPTTNKENVKLWRVREFNGLELLKATNLVHSFSRHMHETFLIVVVEDGIGEFYCRGATRHTWEGSIGLVNPGEMHTGGSAGKIPLTYRSMYPSVDLITEIVCQLDGQKSDFVHFPAPVVYDKELAGSIRYLHRLFESGVDGLKSQELYLDTFSRLLDRHSKSKLKIRPPGDEKTAVKDAKEYILENYSDKISLARLAEVSRLSVFHLLRSFRKIIGLPPHQFLICIRVERAKELLGKGESIAQVAYQTGFADQAHLTRAFKSLTGVTPGHYIQK